VQYRLADKAGHGEVVFHFGAELEHWYDHVAAVSLGLHLAHPAYFLPYGFRRRFHDLQAIHEDFGILGRLVESARMVLETKFQLTSLREFGDAFLQAKSYALRLQSHTMVLAAREGLWIFQRRSGSFDMKSNVFKSWAELRHPDAFHFALSLIGRAGVFGRPTHSQS
jgi:hypothetical protein